MEDAPTSQNGNRPTKLCLNATLEKEMKNGKFIICCCYDYFPFSQTSYSRGAAAQMNSDCTAKVHSSLLGTLGSILKFVHVGVFS
jgi:hypothetical protein